MSSVESGTIGVVIGIYGDFSTWVKQSIRAIDSIASQTKPPEEFIVSYGKTLAEARNKAILSLNTEWCIVVDADDEIEPDFLTKVPVDSEHDILAPLITLNAGPAAGYRIPAASSIIERNWVIVGSPFRISFFRQVGGFRELEALEDWDLWIRMWEIGAKFGTCSGVYRIHERQGSRNRSFDPSALEPKIKADHEERQRRLQRVE